MFLAYYLLCLAEEEEESEEDPLDLSNEEFFSLYRTDQETFLHTCDILKKHLKPGTNGYSVEMQVLSTLRLLGSGSYQDAIAEEDFLRMSQATVSRNLNKVVATLINNMREHIKFSITSQDQLTIKKGFYKKCGMPNVLGVVDCIHIELPRQNFGDHSKYLNRKGTLSLNVLLACDANGLITNVVARWPGAAKDFDVWKNSNLRKHLEESSYNGYFLGDNSFSCDPWLVTPYLKPKRDFEIALNERIQKMMTVIEQVSRTLKTRFRCLQQLDTGNTRLSYSPEKVCRIITACCILHNIWHNKNTKPSQDEAVPDVLIHSRWPLIEIEDRDLTPSEQGFRLRDELAISLHTAHDVRNVEVRDGANSQSELASDLLGCNTMGSDISDKADKEYRELYAELETEERALREQGSKLRDELAADLLDDNDMNADMPSRDDEESQLEKGVDLERTLTERNSKLRDKLALKLSTDIEKEELAIREGGFKLRDKLAADLLDDNMNADMPSRDDEESQLEEGVDLERMLTERNSKLRDKLALKLSTDIEKEELAIREGGFKLRDKLAADLLDDNDMNANMPSRDDEESQLEEGVDLERTLTERNSKLRDKLALKLSTDIEKEELTIREGESKLRDKLAADLLDNDMNVDMPSRDDGESQLEGEDLKRTLTERNSKLRDKLALKLSTDIEKEELTIREGESKLRDKLAADLLDNDMNVDMPSSDDGESQLEGEDLKRTLRERNSKLRDKLALKLSTDIGKEELAIREGGFKLRGIFAADLLDNEMNPDMPSRDDGESQLEEGEDLERSLTEQNSKLRDKLALKLSTDIKKEELAIGEGRSKLRDELAADMLDDNDMKVDMPSRDDRKSQLQGVKLEQMPREQGSELRDNLALKPCTKKEESRSEILERPQKRLKMS